MNPDIMLIYKTLLDKYGRQGWWPVYSLRNTEGRDNRGYYIDNVPVGTGRDLSLRKSSKFEIAIGAILTQNTAWKNVEKAIDNLINLNLMNPKIILETSQDDLADAIRPSGYYNQKAKKLKILSRFLLDGGFLKDGNIPKRDDLLGLWGIGEETADSILLYAYGVPVFVIDAYTRRLFVRIGIIDGCSGRLVGSKLAWSFVSLTARLCILPARLCNRRLRPAITAEVFTSSLEKDPWMFQEYHALIVRHVKEHCRKKPDCKICVLKDYCSHYADSESRGRF